MLDFGRYLAVFRNLNMILMFTLCKIKKISGPPYLPTVVEYTLG